MATAPSDALVFFGATGDLAYKQIFPVAAGTGARRGPQCPDHRRRQGRLEPGPVEGARHRQPAASRRRRSEDVAAAARPAALCGRRLQRPEHLSPRCANSSARRSARCTISRCRPSLFATVAEALAKSGCADGARLVIEKPFGHDRTTARALSRLLRSSFPRRTSSASITTSARSRCRTSSTRASPIRCSSRCGTATTSAASRSPWPRISACRIAGSSTTRPARCATWCRTTCCRCWRN